MAVSGSDVIVVGAGIAGVAAAWRLAEAGVSVTVVDRVGVAGGASALNAGLIDAPGWGRRPSLDALLKMGSLALFNQLVDERGHDIGLRSSGGLSVVPNGSAWAYAEERVRAARRDGYDVELLDAEQARSAEPGLSDAIAGAILTPASAHADPVSATRAIATEAERAGATIISGVDVSGVRGSPGHWAVVTAGGAAFEAEVLVLAGGAWSAAMARWFGADLPVVALRGQMWATAPLPEGRIRHTISSVESSMAFAASGSPLPVTHEADGRRVTRHLYGRQRANGEIVFGGDRVVAPDPSVPAEVDDAGIAVNRGQATEVLPFLADMPVVRTWAGLMPFTADGLPLIGPLGGVQAVHVVGGLGSTGFNRGPMAGWLAADLVLGRDVPPEVAAARPDRAGGQSSVGR